MRISDWSSDVCSSVLNLTDIFFSHPSLKPVRCQWSREGHHRGRPSGIALAPPPPRALGGRLHHRSEIPMTRDEMMGLKPLDIIRHKTNADAFIVYRVSVDMLREGMAVTGHKIRVTAVRVIEGTKSGGKWGRQNSALHVLNPPPHAAF